MRVRSPFQLFAILGLLLHMGCTGGQGGDPGQTGRDAGVPGGFGGVGGSGGASGIGGAGGGAGSPPTGGAPPEPATCEPRPDPADDACLACLANNCCEELHFGGAGNITDTELPDTVLGRFFLCVRSCVEDASDADGGLFSNLADAALNCGPGCTHTGPGNFDYIRADLIACSTGGPRPIPRAGEEPNFEYGMDADGGLSDHNCADVCF